MQVGYKRRVARAMGTYPNVARDLVEACDDFVEGRIGLGEFQSWVLNVADQIALVDERDVREYLESAEGELEMIRFTSDEVLREARRVAAEIRARMLDYIGA